MRHCFALSIALITLFASVGASAEVRVTRLDEQGRFADIDLSGSGRLSWSATAPHHSLQSNGAISPNQAATVAVSAPKWAGGHRPG